MRVVMVGARPFRPFGLVFVDYSMPGFNGEPAQAKRARAAGAFAILKSRFIPPTWTRFWSAISG